MNKWRRDPISSWQSFWKRGQLISQRSPHLSTEQPVLPAPCVAWSSSALPPSAEVSTWRETPLESCGLSAAKSYSFISRPAIFIYIFVFAKRKGRLLQTFLSFIPPIHLLPHPQETSIPGGFSQKEMEISWCVLAVILGFFF